MLLKYQLLSVLSSLPLLAYYATEDWKAANKHSFDIINMMPTFILGDNRLITNVEDLKRGTGGGTANGFVLSVLLGQKSDSTPASSIHVDDVALAHIKALDPAVPGNQSFVLSGSRDGID
jgi:hypothetical protein